MKRCVWVLFWVLLLTSVIKIPLLGDDHVVEERTRTYMGRTLPPMKTDIWISENALCYQSRTFMYIKRLDLKKMYTINMGNKRYLEESLEPAPEKAEDEGKEERIQELGFNYFPVFDWIVKKTEKEKIIDGKKCKLYVLDGDADYAEEKRELWVTKDVPIDIGRYYEQVIEPNMDKEWRKVYEQHPELKQAVTFQSQYETESAIASTMTWKTKIIKIEAADPPEGIYEIPEGLTLVKTREELYER